MEFTARFLFTARPTQNKIDFLCKQMKLTPEQVELCVDADPSPNQTDYVTWLARWLAKGMIRLPEDTPGLKDQLVTFQRLKRTPGFTGNKDINQYTPAQLYEVVQENTATAFLRNKNQDKLKELPQGAAEVVAHQGDILIYKTRDVKALNILSDSTNWCTRHEMMAKRYLKNGPSYVVFYKGEPYAQLHTASNQYMDKADRPLYRDYKVKTQGWGRGGKKRVAQGMTDPVAVDALEILRKLDPAVEKWAQSHNVNTTPEDLADQLRFYPEYKLEVAYLRRRPYSSHDEVGLSAFEPGELQKYADLFHPKGRWEPLEESILSHKLNGTAVKYTKERMGGRWDKIEPQLLKGLLLSPNAVHLALRYCTEVIGGRWPELEKKLIAARPNEIPATGLKEYAEHVLQTRWADITGVQMLLNGMAQPEYKMTLGSPEQAISYAKHFIKGRWPALEQVLRQAGDTEHLVSYMRSVVGERDLEMEPDALRNATTEQLYNYASDVVKGRDPEIEKKLLAKPDKFALRYAQHVIKGRWPELEPLLLKTIAERDAVKAGDDGEYIPHNLEEINSEYWNTPRQKFPEAIRDYVELCDGRWAELEQVLLQRYQTHPQEWNTNQKWVEGYIDTLHHLLTTVDEVDEETGEVTKRRKYKPNPPDWPEGRKRLAERCPEYEEVITRPILEALQNKQESADDWDLFQVGARLYRYVKALQHFGTRVPEAEQLLKTLQAYRDEVGGFWNENSRFASALLKSKPYDI
jgi:hypothetical protein